MSPFTVFFPIIILIGSYPSVEGLWERDHRTDPSLQPTGLTGRADGQQNVVAVGFFSFDHVA